MFKSMKRIIKWAGKYKGRLYLGSVFSFFSSLSTAIPTMAAAYALDKAIAAYWAGNTIESSLIWQTLWITVGSIALNFLLSYLRAVLQESIGYEVAAGQRIHLGDVLKRVPLGYFSKNSVGDILTGVTTELSHTRSAGNEDGRYHHQRICKVYCNSPVFPFPESSRSSDFCCRRCLFLIGLTWYQQA